MKYSKEKLFPGGCLNGSSAGKRRIADNIGAHMTASFFVNHAKESSNLNRDLLMLLSAGATVVVICVVIVLLRVSWYK